MESNALIQIWSAVCLVLGIITFNISDISPAFMFLYITPLLLFFPFFFLRNGKSSFFNCGDLFAPEISETHLVNLLTFIQGGLVSTTFDRETLMLISGSAIDHAKTCSDSRCQVCKKESLSWLRPTLVATGEKKSTEEAKHYLSEVYKKLIDVHPSFMRIKKMYCLFIIEEIGDTALAYAFLDRMLNENSLGLRDRFTFYQTMYCCIIIHSKLINFRHKEEKTLGNDATKVDKIIQFNKFKELLGRASKKYIKLWQAINATEECMDITSIFYSIFKSRRYHWNSS